MSDSKDDFLDQDEVAPSQEAAAKKAGGGNNFLLTILKFVAIGLGAIVFIITVVVITVKIIDRGGKPQSVVMQTENYQSALPDYSYYSNIGEIRTRTIDAAPFAVVIKINLGYPIGSDKAFVDKLTSSTPRMRDAIRLYFSQKTADELQPKNEQVIKQELLDLVNTLVEGGQLKEVLFERFDVTPM
jgi:flagellar protein FliL